MSKNEKLILAPAVRLFGDVNEGMLGNFLSQFETACLGADSEFVMELYSHGGDADVGLRIAQEIRIADQHRGIHPLFLGKTVIYSAAVTIMGAFSPERRFLSRGSTLLIHERKLDKQVHLNGQLRANAQIVRELLSELEDGMRLQADGFRSLVAGTDVSFEEVTERAQTGWYVTAEEAVKRGLVAGVV